MNIRGKIAHIFDETKFILNIGLNDGVRLHQKFVIIEEGDEIIDPDTQESLGKVEIPKGQVVVEHVQEKMAIAVTERATANSGNDKKTLSELMVEASSPLADERLRLNVDRYHMKPSPALSPVKIGDSVRLVE